MNNVCQCFVAILILAMQHKHSMIQFISILDIFLLIVIIFYLYCCPYTKVEESFNLQAVHDILEYGSNIDQYDHLQFPGVVPRTFIGAICVALLSSPVYMVFSMLNASGLHKQMLCRGVLGIIVWSGFVWFRNSIEKVFGNRTSQLFSLLTMFQFHACFYATRTLPNVFAMTICLWSFGYWLQGKSLISILLIAFAAITFRCDMIVLLIPTVVVMLLSKEISFWFSFFAGICVSAMSLLLTFCVDSLFWQRKLWPEGIVLFFNTVENKSAEWGVMPWHWYITNAIPKSLHVTLIWILVAGIGLRYKDPIQNRSTNFLQTLFYSLHIKHNRSTMKALYYALPSFCFVVLYSFLPHKELRFIMPVLPIFTMLGAVGLDSLFPHFVGNLWYPLNELSNDDEWLQLNRKKYDDGQANCHDSHGSLYTHIFSAVVVTSFLAMALLANTLLGASYYNYPGGMALDRLITQHVQFRLAGEADLHNIDRPLFVHIDTLAATSGVSRFVQERFPVSIYEPQHNFFLNAAPFEWKDAVIRLNCVDKNWGECGGDAVFYSKHENVTDYTGFDWVITEDSKFNIKHPEFVIVEKIHAFNKVVFSKRLFPQIHLKGSLYIFQNTVDSV